MEGDVRVGYLKIEEEVGEERRRKVDEMIRSIKRWRKWEVRDKVNVHKNKVKGEVGLKDVSLSPSSLSSFLLSIYLESFPSPLIGKRNGEELMEWMGKKLISTKKRGRREEKVKEEKPPLPKYRFINWFKHWSDEKMKRSIVKKFTNYIVIYMESIVRYAFRAVYRTDGTLFIPMGDYIRMERRKYLEYKKKCRLKERKDKGAPPLFTLRMTPVGNTIRPIIKKEKREGWRQRVYLAGLRYHAEAAGICQQSLLSSSSSISSFSSRAHSKMYYLKSDIKAFYPSIDQRELMWMIGEIVKGRVTVVTHKYKMIRNGKECMRIKSIGSHDIFKAKARLHQALNPKWKIIKSSFVFEDIDETALKQILEREIRHTISYRGSVYSVEGGIGQGSIFSPLFGLIYLYERIRRIIPLAPRETLITLYADDFLIISFFKNIIEKYATELRKDDMGVAINDKKTIHNLNGREVEILHWCGITFHTRRFAIIKKRRVKKKKINS